MWLWRTTLPQLLNWLNIAQDPAGSHQVVLMFSFLFIYFFSIYDCTTMWLITFCAIDYYGTKTNCQIKRPSLIATSASICFLFWVGLFNPLFKRVFLGGWSSLFLLPRLIPWSACIFHAYWLGRQPLAGCIRRCPAHIASEKSWCGSSRACRSSAPQWFCATTTCSAKISSITRGQVSIFGKGVVFDITVWLTCVVVWTALAAYTQVGSYFLNASHTLP